MPIGYDNAADDKIDGAGSTVLVGWSTRGQGKIKRREEEIIKEFIRTMTIAENINILGNYCGKRDVEELTTENLQKKCHILQADVMVLFGGSILCGGDVLARAIEHRIAKYFIIVGGAGHTTPTLRANMNKAYPKINTENLSEAEIFNSYLKYRYSVQADYIETKSTNCGNNITFLLELLEKEKIACNHMILSQDATMQYRMEMGMRKYRPDMDIINFATYHAVVQEQNGSLNYNTDIWGMWDMERYISLLLGEIPRLKDDENGYGPKGKGFIAHVDIPQSVENAFDELKHHYSDLIRTANPVFAAAKEMS